MHPDAGSDPENTLLKELCRTLKINESRTTAYHPRGNRKAEKANYSLKALLDAFADSRLLPRLQWHHPTIYGPMGFDLWTDREVVLPSDIRFPVINGQSPIVPEYVSNATHFLQMENQVATHRCQETYYGKKCFGPPLGIGARVWFHKI